MKVIVTGSTGFIGGQVLRQCIENPAFDSVVAVARRELTDSVARGSSKMQTVILREPPEWSKWTDATSKAFEGADMCIWAIGPTQKSKTTDPAVMRHADYDWPLHFATSLSTNPHPSGRPFRFVYISGTTTEKDPAKKLWFMSITRHNKGEAEAALSKLANSRATALSCIVARPAMVYPKDTSGAKAAAMLSSFSVRVDELAAAVIRAALEEGTGGTGPVARTMENGELVTEGRRALGVTSVTWTGQRITKT